MPSHSIQSAGADQIDRGRSIWSVPAIAAGSCFVSAIATGLIGARLIIDSWRDPATHLSTAGVGLLVSMTGFVLIGAHYVVVSRERKSADGPSSPAKLLTTELADK